MPNSSEIAKSSLNVFGKALDVFYTRYCIYSYLRDTGYHTIYAYIHGDNFVSLQASRLFLKPIGRIWYVQPRGCKPLMIGGRGRGFPELRKEL
jgi:hypothetical protein